MRGTEGEQQGSRNVVAERDVAAQEMFVSPEDYHSFEELQASKAREPSATVETKGPPRQEAVPMAFGARETSFSSWISARSGGAAGTHVNNTAMGRMSSLRCVRKPS